MVVSRIESLFMWAASSSEFALALRDCMSNAAVWVVELR